MTIEDTILSSDRRGVSKLREYLADDFCDRAAALILGHPGPAIIVTGFYILASHASETDGPPGAVAIGRALAALGREVFYVTDRYHVPLMAAIAKDDSRVVDFPIAGHPESKEFARELLAELDPSVVIAIERCSLTEGGIYFNMHMEDISEYTAKVDYLFYGQPATVGIGDGGNEIGMGKLKDEIAALPTLVDDPAATATSEVIVSSVSNWGGYGLVAAMSQQVGKDLLPSVEDANELIMRTADLGAVDGFSKRQEYRVDGFSLEENGEILDQLHEALAIEGAGH